MTDRLTYIVSCSRGLNLIQFIKACPCRLTIEFLLFPCVLKSLALFRPYFRDSLSTNQIARFANCYCYGASLVKIFDLIKGLETLPRDRDSKP